MNGDGPKPIKKANDKRWTRIAQVILLGAFALPIGILLTGWAQDLMGVHCRGLFGATARCFETSWLTIIIALASPVTWIVGIIVLAVLIVATLKQNKN